MSDTSNTSCQNSVPGWIASGVLGLALGVGGGALGMQAYGNRSEAVDANKGTAASAPVSAPAAGGPAAMGGGPPMMGMGGMGGGMMGGMMGGGGGGGKRALTSLVGKLELLSRPDLKLHVELTTEQAREIAVKLEEFDKAEKMTGDEAQTAVDVLEALLTAEQKAVVDAIGLPFGRGGGGGRGAAGRPGGGSPGTGGPTGSGGPPGGGPPGGMMGMGGMGGGNTDENPFSQEANQKRLRDLLARLAPEAADAGLKPPLLETNE